MLVAVVERAYENIFWEVPRLKKWRGHKKQK